MTGSLAFMQHFKFKIWRIGVFDFWCHEQVISLMNSQSKIPNLGWWRRDNFHYWFKVEKILKGSLNLIPSPSPSWKIQIMGGKVCLKCEGKTLLCVVNKLLKMKSLLRMPSNVLPLHLEQTFPPIFWIFIEDECDGIECRLSS